MSGIPTASLPRRHTRGRTNQKHINAATRAYKKNPNTIKLGLPDSLKSTSILPRVDAKGEVGTVARARGGGQRPRQ